MPAAAPAGCRPLVDGDRRSLGRPASWS